MRIGITSFFHPGVGGIETITRQLAEGMTHAGHDVTVITSTPAGPADPIRFPFRVVRRPGGWRLLAEMRRLDVLLQMGAMLRTAWAAKLTGTRLVIAHHTWLDRDAAGQYRLQGRAKRQLTAGSLNIIVSPALQTEAAGRTILVPNCYDDRIFRSGPPLEERQGLAFVGRLVSDKGLDLLLKALARIAEEGLRPSLTVIGDGPERAALTREAEQLGLVRQVKFLGALPADEVAKTLQQHRILVVPSRWEEPFGLVVLEGLACGCRIVGSRSGVMRELPPVLGSLCERNDLAGLVQSLRQELDVTREPVESGQLRRRFLAGFTPAAMVQGYLRAVTEAAPGPWIRKQQEDSPC